MSLGVCVLVLALVCACVCVRVCLCISARLISPVFRWAPLRCRITNQTQSESPFNVFKDHEGGLRRGLGVGRGDWGRAIVGWSQTSQISIKKHMLCVARGVLFATSENIKGNTELDK